LINNSDIQQVKMPLPSLDIQKHLVGKLDEEYLVIESTKRVIEVFTKKMQDRRSELWGK
jgi:restriction endonuclease S subunit